MSAIMHSRQYRRVMYLNKSHIEQLPAIEAILVHLVHNDDVVLNGLHTTPVTTPCNSRLAPLT